MVSSFNDLIMLARSDRRLLPCDQILECRLTGGSHLNCDLSSRSVLRIQKASWRIWQRTLGSIFWMLRIRYRGWSSECRYENVGTCEPVLSSPLRSVNGWLRLTPAKRTTRPLESEIAHYHSVFTCRAILGSLVTTMAPICFACAAIRESE